MAPLCEQGYQAHLGGEDKSPEGVCELSEKGPNLPVDICFQEAKRPVASVLVSSSVESCLGIGRWSTLTKAVVAWALRFCKNVRLAGNERHLTFEEVNTSRLLLLRYVQKREFMEETRPLREGRPLPKGSPLCKLSPFMVDGLLQVRGSLQFSGQPFDAKHPIFVPKGACAGHLHATKYFS